jgi:hypothetical protein
VSNQAGAREFRVGAIVGSPAILAALLYLLLTPEGPHRGVLLGVVGLGVVSVVTVLVDPVRGWIERGDTDGTMTAWCASFVALATVACLLDSGLHSPFVAVYFISVTYAAVALPTRRVLLIAGLDIAGLLVVGATRDAATSAELGALALWVSGLVAAAAIGALVSEDRQRRTGALRRSQHEIVHRLARVVESRDNETGEHVDRMSRYAELIAAELGWSGERCQELRLAAALHDVGKVAVPDAILLKPGQLSPEERLIMQQHCQAGHEMLSGSDSSLLDLAAIIALTHHERWDGAGYPCRRAGDSIPQAGRIVAVADVFDALTSRRVYKPAMRVRDAVTIIREGRGTQFDPAVVDAFLRRIDQVIALYSDSRHLESVPPAPAAVQPAASAGSPDASDPADVPAPAPAVTIGARG